MAYDILGPGELLALPVTFQLLQFKLDLVVALIKGIGPIVKISHCEQSGTSIARLLVHLDVGPSRGFPKLLLAEVI